MSLATPLPTDDTTPHTVHEASLESPHALIVVYQQRLAHEQMQRIRIGLEKALDGRKVIVIDGGPQIYDAPTDVRLAALERDLGEVAASLKTLLEHLEDDSDKDEDLSQVLDLEGNRVGKPRDQRKPL